VKVYQEMLQPVQDHLNALRQKLEAVAGELDRVQERGEEQDRVVSDLQQVLSGLITA
jgi:hypothetical protein